MSNVNYSDRGRFYGVVIVAALVAEMVSALIGANAHSAEASQTPVVVTASGLGTVRPVNGGWWVDKDASGTGQLSVATGDASHDPALQLGLPNPDATSKVYLYHAYPANARPTDVAPLRAGASYTYAGTNVNFQIELVYRPNDPAFGPNPVDPRNPGADYCDSANAWGFTNVGSDWCYTAIKWEPLLRTSGWKTVDLTADTAINDTGNPSTLTPGWRTQKRIGIYPRLGAFSGSGTFTQYLTQIAQYQVAGFVVGAGSGTVGPATGWVKGITFAGTSYTFATVPTQPSAPSVALTNGADVAVSWLPPANDGGAHVTGYDVTLAPSSGEPASATVAAATSHTFTALAAGSYTATVTATNAAGTSPTSPVSVAIVVPPRVVTVGTGGYPTIQSAINAVAAGGTVNIPPGTYIQSVQITRGQSVNLVGIGTPGSVVLKQVPTGGTNKVIDIYNTASVSITNLAIVADPANPTPATGIDINSAQDVALSGVSVTGFLKNGISLTGKWAASTPTTSSNISFDSVTAAGNSWAGIALYTKNKSGTVSVGISGVTFGGTTRVSGNRVGIQFGDPGDVDAVRGVSDAAVNLGMVSFGNNRVSLQTNDSSRIIIGRTSTIDGAQITAAGVPLGVAVVPLIATNTSLSISPSAPAIPGTRIGATVMVQPAVAGTVTIYDGSVPIASAVVRAGEYSTALRQLTVGTHSLTARFSPTAGGDYAASAAPITSVTVLAPPVSTAVTLSASPAGSVTFGTAVDLAAVMAPRAAEGVVIFYDGSASIARADVRAGVARVDLPFLAIGTHSFRAVFVPSDLRLFTASTSSRLPFSVDAPPVVVTPGPLTIATPPPPPVTRDLVITEIGSSATDLLQRYAVANGGATPPEAATVFTIAAGSAPNAAGAFSSNTAFTAAVPWSSANGDSWVDVWAYSSPRYIGTFPVINGVLQITGADLSALTVGGHHLALVGQTSGANSVVALKIAQPTIPQAETKATAEPRAGSIDAAGEHLNGFVWAGIAFLIIAILSMCVYVATRRTIS